MRIQHNIMAMNSYRNLSGNNTALSKNLEKLSSGYRINRAGDDAAGLAISEKMRAQIAGLDQAQKNAQSGINLVKTAEGALTEVHDMLNRMTTLATQSANGTYSNTDREKLQAEVDALIEEIDRIADNSNFNGTKLLDGSLAEGTEGSTTNTAFDAKNSLTSELRAGATDVNAIKGVYTASGFGSVAAATFGDSKAMANGDKINITVNFTDADGKEQSTTVTLKVADTGVSTGKMMVLDDGSENGIALSTTYATAGQISAAEMELLAIEALTKTDAVSENFKVTDTTTANASDGTLQFTAVEAGTKGAVLNSISVSHWDKSEVGTKSETTALSTKTNVTTVAKDANLAYNFVANGKVWDPNATDDKNKSMAALEDAIFEVNGEKFVFIDKDVTSLTDEQKNQLEAAGVKHWVVATGTTESATNSGITDADLTKMAAMIEKETGLDVKVGATTAAGAFDENAAAKTMLMFENGKVAVEGIEGNELKLQIGADSVETIGVSIESMKAKSLGLDKLSIGDVENANKAIDTIKNAIEQVSVTRGNLGAIQNRLEHTINNLGVMEENIQDAESNIRDTDVADEMMAYTKNNILIQSAQAMLAQANQVPQGVLQLMG